MATFYQGAQLLSFTKYSGAVSFGVSTIFTVPNGQYAEVKIERATCATEFHMHTGTGTNYLTENGFLISIGGSGNYSQIQANSAFSDGGASVSLNTIELDAGESFYITEVSNTVTYTLSVKFYKKP